MDNTINRIKRTHFRELLEQNRIMRELIQKWPAREIMMDYEKQWNEEREEFLKKHPPLKPEI